MPGLQRLATHVILKQSSFHAHHRNEFIPFQAVSAIRVSEGVFRLSKLRKQGQGVSAFSRNVTINSSKKFDT